MKTGLAAMRFRSQGGTRPDGVGHAPARWLITAKEYPATATDFEVRTSQGFSVFVIGWGEQ